MAGYSDQFATDLNRLLGVPDTPASHQFYAAWAKAEGGGAAFNPFNTTQKETGASSYNSVGVRNYVSYQQGLQATATTLENGLYGPIISALKGGKATPMQLAQAEAQTPWGTGSLIEKVLGGGGAGSVPATTPGAGVTAASWYDPRDWGIPTPWGSINPIDPFSLIPGDNSAGIPGVVGGGAGSAIGGAAGDLASGIAGAVFGVLKAFVAPFEKYLEDAVLVVFGLIVVVVGLAMLAKSGSGGGGGGVANPNGQERDEGNAEAGEGAGVEDAAVAA